MAKQTVNEGEEWAAEKELLIYEEPEVRARVLEEARSGIAAHRMAPVRWRFVDAAGTAQAGLAVEIDQLDHAFDFGLSGASTLAAESDPAIAARNALFCDLFNCTTAKCYWDEKWHQPIEHLEGRRVLGTFLDEIDWALAKGLRVRGHPLVWTVEKAIPKWAQRYPYERQLRLVEENCRSLIGAVGGRVKLWDLVNEALWEPSLRNLAQRDWPHLEPIEEMLSYIEPAVGWAKDADPDGRYVINDYGLEVDFTDMKGVTAAQQRRRFVELAEALIARGAAPDALGTQAHVGKWYPMAAVRSTLDELAAPGLPLQVSEFWAHLKGCPDPELAEEAKLAVRDRYVADYYTVAFGHRAVEHITYWGGSEFFDRRGYVPSSLYRTLDKLINHEWHSRIETTTDTDGCVDGRVFHGDYIARWRDERGQPRCRRLRVDPHVACPEMTITV